MAGLHSVSYSVPYVITLANDGDYVFIAEMSYDVNMMYEERRDPDVSGSYAHALRRLSMWRVNP